MSIKIKAVERGQPGVVGGGQKKYYAVPVMGDELTLDLLTKRIEKTSTVNGADIRAVIYALVEEIIDGLEEGRIVRVGDLGSLRVTLSSEGHAKALDVSANSVKKSGVIFTPGSRLKTSLANLKYIKE